MRFPISRFHFHDYDALRKHLRAISFRLGVSAKFLDDGNAAR